MRMGFFCGLKKQILDVFHKVVTLKKLISENNAIQSIHLIFFSFFILLYTRLIFLKKFIFIATVEANNKNHCPTPRIDGMGLVEVS